MNSYLQAMRLERWPRSAAILSGTAAFFFLKPNYLSSFTWLSFAARLLLSFLLTWAISIANYILNEIVDAPYDIHHPTKRFRPLVSGKIRIIPFAAWGVLFILGSLGAALLFFPKTAFFSLVALLLAGFIYNVKPIRTKDIPFFDAISESANNPIRLLIGWYAFSPPEIFPPLSLLIAWWAFGNFLMLGKRLSEFRFLKEKAADYRISHKKYSEGSLLAGMAVSTLIFFIAYFVFALSIKFILFLGLSPFLAFYFFLLFKKTLEEKEVMEEPESLLQRPLFAVYTLVLLILFLLTFFL